MNFPVRTPKLLMGLAPRLFWHMPRKDKIIYLTFDDGPHPEITPRVLEILKRHKAHATFFCVGQNALRYPEVVKQCLTEGHAVGNHTQHHLNGWKTPAEKYLNDVSEAEAVLSKISGKPLTLFRPPYGKLNLQAWRRVRHRYKVVMWDVIAGDFVQNWSAERVTANVVNHAREGSVVVLHDSEKCAAKMYVALEQTLSHFSGLGYRFRALPQG